MATFGVTLNPWAKKSEPSLEQEVKAASIKLEREILDAELKKIESIHNLEANREKLRHMGEWMINRSNRAP